MRLDPDTEALRGKVKQALQELYLSEADLGGRLYWSHMTAAISNVPGELDHTLSLPSADVVPQPHELPVLGDITWL